MSDNLLPCPFCGGAGEETADYIECKYCKARGPYGWGPSETRPAWNRRAQPDTRLVEAAVKADRLLRALEPTIADVALEEVADTLRLIKAIADKWGETNPDFERFSQIYILAESTLIQLGEPTTFDAAALAQSKPCKTCAGTGERWMDDYPGAPCGEGSYVPCPDCKPKCRTCGGVGRISLGINWGTCPDCQPQPCKTHLPTTACLMGECEICKGE